MSKVVATLRSALPYIGDDDVRKAFSDTLGKLEADLDEVGYDESTQTSEAMRSLAEKMNEFDEGAAARRAELSEAIAEARELEEEEEGQ